jgi:hypothetical protein
LEKAETVAAESLSLIHTRFNKVESEKRLTDSLRTIRRKRRIVVSSSIDAVKISSAHTTKPYVDTSFGLDRQQPT